MLEDFEIKDTVRTNLRFIDDVIGGSLNSAIHVVAADSGRGKTALLLQVASSAEVPCLYVNSDMNQNDLYKRLITVSTGVDFSQISKLSKEERSQLVELTRSANSHVIFEEAKAGFVSLTLLKSRILDIIENRRPDTVLLIIDSFNSWIDTAVNHSGRPKDEIVAETLTNLLDFTQEVGLTVLVSAQNTNQSVHKTVNEALEAAADTYITLAWEKSGRANSEGLMETRAFFRKNRNGEANKNTFGKFNGKLQKFSD